MRTDDPRIDVDTASRPDGVELDRVSDNRSRHLRRCDGRPQETTSAELFFDLVYAFAVTQVAQLVIDADLRLVAIGQGSFLLIVVWWAWIYTTWTANRLDPRSRPVRIILSGVALPAC